MCVCVCVCMCVYVCLYLYVNSKSPQHFSKYNSIINKPTNMEQKARNNFTKYPFLFFYKHLRLAFCHTMFLEIAE